ncbi:hypothetical protein GGI09_001893 [Coemansia sp. S100]|nr:hypothetical protein GGI09_001893 [Coemansia sp. S100]
MTTLEQIQLECGSAVATFSVTSLSASSIRELAQAFNTNPTESLSSIEIHAAFIQHCINCNEFEVALAVFDAFCQIYGTTTSDIHVVVQALGLDEDAAHYFNSGAICH